MNVRLSADALADLSNIKRVAVDYNASIADRVIRVIVQTIRMLSTWPNLGHAGHRTGTREFRVSRLPFVIVYTADEEHRRELVVLRIYHVRQHRP